MVETRARRPEQRHPCRRRFGRRAGRSGPLKPGRRHRPSAAAAPHVDQREGEQHRLSRRLCQPSIRCASGLSFASCGRSSTAASPDSAPEKRPTMSGALDAALRAV